VIDTATVAYALEAQGRRPAMEDAHVLEVHGEGDTIEVLGAIFDGHLGDQVAKYAAGRFLDIFHETPHDDPIEQSLSHALEQIHRESALLQGNAGACAVVFHVDKDKIVTANLGDAEAVYVPDYRGEPAELENWVPRWSQLHTLTTAHRLDNPDEILRVYHTGAVIRKPYFHTPQGNGLMPTRSLGDSYLDNWGMSHVPDVGFLSGARRDDKSLYKPGFLVAACDGFWDVVKADDLQDLIRHEEPNAQRVAERLFKEALHVRATTDNLTVIVVRIE
jgi:serine/threonine protein phosphatase PrpC